MKLINKSLTRLVVLGALLVITGCATNGNFLQDNNVAVERNHSQWAYVVNVDAAKTSDGLLINGQVRRRLYSDGRIIGHVDVEILSSNGALLSKSSADCVRTKFKGMEAKFELELDVVPDNGSIIRVTHHNSKSSADSIH